MTFLPKLQNLNLDVRNSRKTQMRDILQNSLLELFKIVKIDPTLLKDGISCKIYALTFLIKWYKSIEHMAFH